jgi:hypothetical protein
MNSNGIAGESLGGCLLVALVNVTIGAWSVHYCLAFIFNKYVPWYIDVLIALFAAELTIPLAITLWILSFFGVHPPLIK